MSSTSPRMIAAVLKRSFRIVARRQSMCGVPKSSWPRPMAVGPPRSCIDPARRNQWSGPGRRGLWRRAWKGMRDKTGKPGKKPLPAITVRHVLDLALGQPLRRGDELRPQTLCVDRRPPTRSRLSNRGRKSESLSSSRYCIWNLYLADDASRVSDYIDCSGAKGTVGSASTPKRKDLYDILWPARGNHKS